MEVADQQASSSMAAADFNENLFQQFMGKNSVWDFHAISRDDYLRKSKADKEQLLLNYYKLMKIDEQYIYYCPLLQRCFRIYLFGFLNWFSPNLAKSLNGVWYICSIVSRMTLGRISWTLFSSWIFIFIILLIFFDALFMILGAWYVSSFIAFIHCRFFLFVSLSVSVPS